MPTAAAADARAPAPLRRRPATLVVALALLLAAGGAAAEGATDSGVTAAEEAFGLTVGNQTIGLYSMNDARGFSPQQAGNLRIEGLYFDSSVGAVGPCTAGATMMRIGLSAQTYSFPAPTGIADLRLALPGDHAAARALLTRGPYDEATALVEGQTPLTDALGGSVCAGYNRDFAPDQARRAENWSLGTAWRWHPAEHTEVVPFWSTMSGGQHQMLPLVFSDGLEPPPLYDARDLASQPFTSAGWRTTAFGVVVRQSFGSAWSLAAGLFHAHEQDRQSYVEEYLSVLPDRSVVHMLDVVPPLSSGSSSGELRLVRHFVDGAHERTLDLSVRGRSADRAYGGDTLIDYGPASLDSGPPGAPLGSAISDASVDETRQVEGGVEYEERWPGVGSVGIGILKSRYRRTIRTAGLAPQSLLTEPWLANLRFTADAGEALKFYGSFLQGLEDSALAPYSATNRGQPPPATRTRQIDAGLRYTPSARLSLVAGAFEIDKAYFNLDATNLYTALGEVRHRGIESSLAYAAEGLTVVAGGVWLRPHVERRIPEPGATGDVPLGPVPLTLNLTADYAPARWHPLAASLQWSRLSARVATTDDRYFLPVLSTLGVGLRYEARAHGHPLSVRLDALNVTDARGLHLSPVAQVTPELGRRYLLSFTIDR